MAHDQQSSEVGSQTPTRRRDVIHGVVVAAIASVTLTVAGHYFANLLTGQTTQEPRPEAIAWLVLFMIIGLALALTATATMLPGWRRSGAYSIFTLVGGLILATFDHWGAIDAPAGLAFNAAGVAVVVAALQSIKRTPRSPLPTIGVRTSERVQEWLGGTLVLAGFLAFVLPHSSAINDVSETCSPVWILLDTHCLSADITWWPIPLAAIAVGITLLMVIHHDPTISRPHQGQPAPMQSRRDSLPEYPYVTHPKRKKHWF